MKVRRLLVLLHTFVAAKSTIGARWWQYKAPAAILEGGEDEGEQGESGGRAARIAALPWPPALPK